MLRPNTEDADGGDTRAVLLLGFCELDFLVRVPPNMAARSITEEVWLVVCVCVVPFAFAMDTPRLNVGDLMPPNFCEMDATDADLL